MDKNEWKCLEDKWECVWQGEERKRGLEGESRVWGKGRGGSREWTHEDRNYGESPLRGSGPFPHPESWKENPDYICLS